MERTNFRYVKPENLTDGKPDFAVTDVSFISLRLIFPPLKALLKNNADVVALIKPQFEAGREQVGKKGIIRDSKIHEQVLESIIEFVYLEGFSICDLDYSPITGGDGNIEFLLHAKWTEDSAINKVNIEKQVQVVKDAHEAFRNIKLEKQ